MKKAVLAFSLVTVALLSACGGSSSSPSAESGSGVAAVGAPISLGTLSAIDATGKTASATIAESGAYSLAFLNGLTAPVLLRVEGVSGGRTVVHFGVATSTTQSVVNVTPVSTAVVAQAMQADPGTVFAEADTSKIRLLTASQVATANTLIGNELATTRSNAGLSGSGAVDFLNTSFSADKTGLDKVLDLVRISVSPNLSVQLKNKTADGVTTVGANGSVSGSLGSIETLDTRSIDELGQALQTAFENGAAPWLSNSPTVQNLFSSSFLHGGQLRAAVIAGIAADAEDMRGAKFLPAKLLNCSASGGGPICEALFTVRYTDGALELFTFPLRYEAGQWKVYGNQAPTHTEYGAVVYRELNGTNAPVTRSGFNINVFDDAKVGMVDVGYVKIWFGTNTTGEPEGVFVNPGIVSGSCNGRSVGYLEVLTNPTNNNSCAGNFIALSNTRIDELRSTFAVTRPKIMVRYYDALGNRIGTSEYVITVEALPPKTNEVTDGNFAIVSNTSWTQFSAAGVGGQFTLAVSKGPNVGLEDVVGARPLGTTNLVQKLPYSTVRTGTSWNVLRANSYLITVTRDSDGRMYWYQRQ